MSTNAMIQQSNVPFAQGSFKTVWLGYYTRGPRKGEQCVSKVFFNTGSVFEAAYFSTEMEVIRQNQHIIDAWNAARVINMRIVLNTPQIWAYAPSGEMNQVEPFIPDFRKLNSNTGWAPLPGDPWGDVVQALSHFSYHNPGGQMLLCDIQGVTHQSEFIISDPGILSLAGSYGRADLGLQGIYRFFAHHQCTQFCRPGWTKAQVTWVHSFAMRRGTTMSIT